MSKKTLLLSSSYQVLNFITEQRVIKLIVKERVEVLENWPEYIVWASCKIHHPSIVRLKNNFVPHFYKNCFSRNAVIRRDKSTCQYCNKRLSSSQITIDHIIPRAKGGITSFSNCVVCCKPCNSKKGNMTLEEASMELLKKPVSPSFSDYTCQINMDEEHWCQSWDDYMA
jgi:hypothetical protein